MLNFYNYYRKIHPELVNLLEELDRKITLLSQSTNDTLIIRVSRNGFKYNENKFAKGEVIFTNSFGANNTIKLSEEQTLHILRDIKLIMLYYHYECSLLFKTSSDVESGIANFGKYDDGIKLENNTLIRRLPS